MPTGSYPPPLLDPSRDFIPNACLNEAWAKWTDPTKRFGVPVSVVGSTCYFCGAKAECDRNGIPQCSACVERYEKK